MQVKSVDFYNLLKSVATYNNRVVIDYLEQLLSDDTLKLSSDKRMFLELYNLTLREQINQKIEAKKHPCYRIYDPTTGLYVGKGFRFSKHGKAWLRKSDVKLLINSNFGKFGKANRRDNSILTRCLIIDVVNNTEENAYDFWKSS